MKEEFFKNELNKLCEYIAFKQFEVYDIFKEFFGAPNVDIQNIPTYTTLEDNLKSTAIALYFSPSSLNISAEDWLLYSNDTINELPQEIMESAFKALYSNLHIIKVVSGWTDSTFILVHFPKVRVTNEHNKYVDITHLWAKIEILYDGRLKDIFYLNRSEYTVEQFMSNYMHSHIPTIPKGDFTTFLVPCVGDGPIGDTMTSLRENFDKDLWELFCLELSNFVTVESLTGTPFKFLEEIGNTTMSLKVEGFRVFNHINTIHLISNWNKLFKDFVRHFIQGNYLKFNYVNGSYSIGMGFNEYLITISNVFIKWYNNNFKEGKAKAVLQELIREGIIIEGFTNNGRIYYLSSKNYKDQASCLSYYIGQPVCTFKGKKVTVSISDLDNIIENRNVTHFFSYRISLYILNQIFKVLNYRYGRYSKNNSTNSEVEYL